MAIKKKDVLPPRLEGARRRFEQWRRKRKAGTRIPQALWDAAARMAREYGINRTATALRINYYALKKRVERIVDAGKSVNTATTPKNTGENPASTAFFELAPLELSRSELSSGIPVGLCECTLELEDPGGARMRVCLKGTAVPDLATLSREFWRGEA